MRCLCDSHMGMMTIFMIQNLYSCVGHQELPVITYVVLMPKEKHSLERKKKLLAGQQFYPDTTVLNLYHGTVNSLVLSGLCQYTLGSLLHVACLQPDGAVSSLCVHHQLMVHVHLCSLRNVHSCTFSTMQWDDEVQLITT